MKTAVRWPAPPGETWSWPEVDAFVGARLYVPDGKAQREIGYVIDAKRYNRGTVAVLECDIHNQMDLLIVEMRAFTVGQSLIP